MRSRRKASKVTLRSTALAPRPLGLGGSNDYAIPQAKPPTYRGPKLIKVNS